MERDTKELTPLRVSSHSTEQGARHGSRSISARKQSSAICCNLPCKNNNPPTQSLSFKHLDHPGPLHASCDEHLASNTPSRHDACHLHLYSSIYEVEQHMHRRTCELTSIWFNLPNPERAISPHPCNARSTPPARTKIPTSPVGCARFVRLTSAQASVRGDGDDEVLLRPLRRVDAVLRRNRRLAQLSRPFLPRPVVAALSCGMLGAAHQRRAEGTNVLRDGWQAPEQGAANGIGSSNR